MPTKNTEAIKRQICNLLAQGHSLCDICKAAAMPSMSTVYTWLMPGNPAYQPDFLDQYRVARMWQTESFIERIIELSKDASLPAEAKKIQIDALKTAVAKLEGRKYGDDKPRQITVKVVYVSTNSTSPPHN